MTLTGCRRAEKLMPLYAAGDLPRGRRERAVAAHVARCAACAALAEEFRASREWVRAADAVPEFGEEFYESMRAGVLDRVNRDTRPAAPSRPAPLFPAMFAGRRLAYAASLALAACALALALYLFRDDDGRRRNDIAVLPPAVEVNAPPRHAPATPTPDANAGGRQPSQDEPRGRRQPARPRDEITGGGFKRTPTLRRPPRDDRTSPPSAARAPQSAAASGPAQRQGVAPVAETASVARIEIQTADPSIRIIWLAPDKGEEAEPDKVDPDR